MAEFESNVRGKDEVAAKKAEKQRRKNNRDGFWGNVRVICEALAIALIIRTLFFQPFHIPSGSMKPNLLIGDYIVINKMAYGYSRFSCPFALCPIGERWFGSEPERGDVVVFANPGPRNHNKAYVKRLIGMPGDRVQVKNSIFYVNGEELPQDAMDDFAEPLSDYLNERRCRKQDNDFCFVEQNMETLPEGLQHSVLNVSDNELLDNTDEFIVPEGHYMMIGDNRDNSDDSRLNVGMVPYKNLIGKVSVVVFSSSGSSLFKFWDWRGDRFFKKVE